MDQLKTRLQKLQKTQFVFTNAKGEILEISSKGSLGMLATGYKGLIAVRQKRQLEKLEESS